MPGEAHAIRLADRVLDAVPSAVLVADTEGRIVYANARAAEILERSPSWLAGRRLAEVVPEVAEHVAAPAADLASQQVEYRSPSGRLIHIGFRPADLRPVPGATPLRLVIFQDITETEKVRAERDRLLRIAAVGEVMPAMLHELQNPLATATAALEVLIEDLEPGRVQDDLHAVLGELRRMRLTLEGAGLVSEPAGDARNAAVDLALTETFRVLERQLAARGIRAHCAVPALPLLPVDAGVTRAVAFNLLNNAMQACRPGDAVELGARLDGEALEYWVADTGPGMAPEVLAHCTDLFFTTKPSGSGIGLALCARTVERMGGRLQISSEPGRGTRALVRLPIAPGRAAAAPTSHAGDPERREDHACHASTS